MEGLDEIAKSSIAPILDRLAQRAREEMGDFCKERCGHAPEGCPEAERLHRRFLMMLFKDYASNN